MQAQLNQETLVRFRLPQAVVRAPMLHAWRGAAGTIRKIEPVPRITARPSLQRARQAVAGRKGSATAGN